MKGQRRSQTDDATRNQLGRLGKRMMRVELGACELVKSTREPRHQPLLFKPLDGGARDALVREFGQTHESLLFEQRKSPFGLGLWHAVHGSQYDTESRICQVFIQ